MVNALTVPFQKFVIDRRPHDRLHDLPFHAASRRQADFHDMRAPPTAVGQGGPRMGAEGVTPPRAYPQLQKARDGSPIVAGYDADLEDVAHEAGGQRRGVEFCLWSAHAADRGM